MRDRCSAHAVLCVALLLLCMAGAFGETGLCNNPLANSRMHVFGSSVAVRTLTEPAYQPDFKYCPSLRGKLVCCDPMGVHNLRIALLVADFNLEAFSVALHDLECESLVQLLREMGIPVSKEDEPIICAALEEARVLHTDVNMCVGGIIGYVQGLMCLTCDPDCSGSYYNSTTGALALSENTCTRLSRSCSQYFKKLSALEHHTDDICHRTLPQYKDCEEYVCHGLVNGLNASGPAILVPPKETGQHWVDALAARAPDMSEADREAVVRRMLWAERLMLDPAAMVHHATNTMSVGEALVLRTLRRLLLKDIRTPIMNDIVDVTEHGGLHNEYVSDGFNVMSQGCKVKISSFACFSGNSGGSSGKKVSTWVIVAGMVGIAVLAVLVVVVFYSKKRQITASDEALIRVNSTTTNALIDSSVGSRSVSLTREEAEAQVIPYEDVEYPTGGAARNTRSGSYEPPYAAAGSAGSINGFYEVGY